MGRNFVQNMSRDLEKFRGKLKNKTQVEALDYMSRVGIIQVLLNKTKGHELSPNHHYSDPLFSVVFLS
jgi:hypothetical protein